MAKKRKQRTRMIIGLNQLHRRHPPRDSHSSRPMLKLMKYLQTISSIKSQRITSSKLVGSNQIFFCPTKHIKNARIVSWRDPNESLLKKRNVIATSLNRILNYVNDRLDDNIVNRIIIIDLWNPVFGVTWICVNPYIKFSSSLKDRHTWSELWSKMSFFKVF